MVFLSCVSRGTHDQVSFKLAYPSSGRILTSSTFADAPRSPTQLGYNTKPTFLDGIRQVFPTEPPAAYLRGVKRWSLYSVEP